MGRYLYLPFDVLQGVSAIIFYYIGFIFNKYNICCYIGKSNSHLVAALVIGILCLYVGMSYEIMGMVTCYYEFWPINVFCAIGGFLFVYAVVVLLRKIFVLSFLAKIGRISILVLCIHLIDIESGVIDYLSKVNIQYCKLMVLLLHIIIPITFSWILSNNKVVQRLFNL